MARTDEGGGNGDGENFTMDDKERVMSKLKDTYLGVPMFTDIDKLESNGANITHWLMRMERAVWEATGFPGYCSVTEILKTSRIDLKIDQIALRIIFNILSKDLKDSVNDCAYAHDVLRLLKDQFRQGCRTAEVATFKDLVLVSFDSTSTSLAKFCNNVDKLMKDLEGTGFQWVLDSVRGMLYQLGAINRGNVSLNKETNAALNVCYRQDKSPFSATEVKAAMQNALKEQENKLSVSSAVRAIIATVYYSLVAQWDVEHLHKIRENSPRLSQNFFQNSAKNQLFWKN